MNDLQDLGLSSYEEKAYRALLARGPSPAELVSETSDVPMGRIYDVLGSLVARDLVRVDEAADPRQYAPVEPSTAVDRLLAARKQELADRREHYEQAARDVTDRLASSPPVESAFWAAGLGTDDARTYLREAVAAAEEQVLLTATGPYEAAEWDEYAEEVEALSAVDDDVAVKVLLPPTLVEAVPKGVLADLLADGVAVRTTDDLHTTLAVVDDREASLDVTAPFAGDERLGGVVVREQEFVADLAGRFETAWAAADSVGDATTPRGG